MHIDKMQLHVTGRIYLYYKREKKSCVVDVTVPNDTCVTQKEQENMKKHTPLKFTPMEIRECDSTTDGYIRHTYHS